MSEAKWIIAAEYTSDTVHSGPYTVSEAMAIRDYAERSDSPMGECDIRLYLLTPPVSLGELSAADERDSAILRAAVVISEDHA